MGRQIYLTTKKTFYYNFFPTKAEEDAQKYGKSGPPSRVLVEIRDIFPPPMEDPNYPWLINKTLNHYEIASGNLVLSFNDTFEHVLRYWTLETANYVVMGQKVGVALWDVTDDPKSPRMYQGNEVYLQMLANDDFMLACIGLMKDRNLKVDDRVSLCWDPERTSFQFKLLSQV